MKTFLIIFFSFTLTFLSFPQTEDDDNVQFGFGVSLSKDLSVYSSRVGELEIETLPIDLANISFIIKGTFFRIEPSVGYHTMSIEFSNAGITYERSSSNTRLGAVVAFNNEPIESMNLYYGIGFGFILDNASFTSTDTDESQDDSKTDFFIGPAVGGEYMFNRYFSLGGEVNLNYISIGNYEYDGDISTWAISTRGLIFLRWYVN